MLRPTTMTQTEFAHLMPPSDYHLDEVRLDIPDPQTAVFRAKLIGPPVRMYGPAPGSPPKQKAQWPKPHLLK